MRVGRVMALLLCLLAVGIWVARERAISARLAHQINEVYGRQLDLKRQLWEQEMEMARLRSPAMLLARVKELTPRDAQGGARGEDSHTNARPNVGRIRPARSPR